MGGLLLGGRGRLTNGAHRRKVIELIGEANAAGANLVSACGEIGICLRTLKPLVVMGTARIAVKAAPAMSLTA